MATRSAIGYLQPSGSVRAVYCHWDGYPKHQLPILEKHYTSTDKVKALIKPGSISSLHTENTWTSDRRDPQPLYYHERGESDIKPITSCKPLFTWFAEHDCEYLYVWDGNKWITYSRDFPEDD